MVTLVCGPEQLGASQWRSFPEIIPSGQQSLSEGEVFRLINEGKTMPVESCLNIVDGESVQVEPDGSE